MSELSVFVDESGNTSLDSRYYLVTLVFHDQSRPIDNDVARLAGRLQSLGFSLDEPVHAGPIIRREGIYTYMRVEDRKRIFDAALGFVRRCGISYATFSYRKSALGALDASEMNGVLHARLARDIELYLRRNIAYFTGFDRVIVYYDNGQHLVASAIHSAFEGVLFGVDFRLVFPHEYRLFQAADLICTLELLRLKAAAHELSRSELGFFGSADRLRKNYLRQLARLRLG